jgi:hypothetical protein
MCKTVNTRIDGCVKHPLTEWLLNAQLLHVRLDVRVQGTTKTLWYNGRYEDACSILVLTAKPSGLDVTVPVKVGYEQSLAHFPLRYLIPEVTTEQPKVTLPSAAQHVISCVGERVVIIGPDLTGNMEPIGCYTLIIHYPYPLDVDQACVIIATMGPLWG